MIIEEDFLHGGFEDGIFLKGFLRGEIFSRGGF